MAAMGMEFWTSVVELGQVRFTPLSLLLGCGLFLTALMVQRALHHLLADRFFPRFKIHRGLGNAYAMLASYAFLMIALFFIIPVTFHGFNFATLSVMVGALSFGLGFGLRNVADNFVSGLIILLERPVKVGDRVTIDAVEGSVREIRARSTTVQTNDNIEVIVPNSRFISESVINWSHNDERVRFRIPVGVHYKSDVWRVKQELELAAGEVEGALADPAPVARFVGFGDSSLDFEIRVWTSERMDRPVAFRSDVNFRIWDRLKAAGIEIPYPQRDLYIKELPDRGVANFHDRGQ